jgi:hypothetical protein
MIRGIRYKIPNENSGYLRLIFDGISLEDYFWCLRNNDVHLKNNDVLFKHDAYDGSEFKKTIEQDEYYMVFLGLLAFPSQTNENVYDYSSFMNSTAVFFVMIVDCIFVDVYIKDAETLALFRKAPVRRIQKLEAPHQGFRQALLQKERGGTCENHLQRTGRDYARLAFLRIPRRLHGGLLRRQRAGRAAGVGRSEPAPGHAQGLEGLTL